MYPVLVLTIALCLTIPTFAKSPIFYGDKKVSHTKAFELKGKVREILESEKDFQVLFGIHAAFYSFPKNKDAKEVKSFLENSKTEGFSIKATVDPLRLKILKLEKDESTKNN